MIDLTDYNTIPVEVGFVVREFVDRLSNESTLLHNEIPLSNKDVRCQLEDYIWPFLVPVLYQTLANILDKENILVFHATKVLFPARLKQEGLRTNAWQQYSNCIKEALFKGGVSSTKIEEALHLVKFEKERRDTNGKNVLCYFANLISFSEKERIGYHHFCQNIGGELARRALKDKMPDVYKVLRNSGERVLVKFSIPFSWIADYEKESIIAHFIYHEAASYLWDYLYDIEFGGSLFQDVQASSIIDVITVEEPDYYD